jgi:predicted Zn-dependent protease
MRRSTADKIAIMCIISGLCASFLLPRVSEAINPNDIIPVSAEKEKSMGASIAKQVEKQFETTSDPLLQKRFEDIGKRIAGVCDRQELVYHFKVLKAKGEKEKYYNAFALPGGYVYIFDAFIEVLETDDKVAAVTAHEIGHICAKHAIERLQSSLGANALMVLGLVTARDGRSLAEANEALAHLMMSYSREAEFEADKLSVIYMDKAGFNKKGVLEALLMLKDIRKKGPQMRYMYYKSHPYLSERIAMVRTEIRGYKDFDSYINLPDHTEGFY